MKNMFDLNIGENIEIEGISYKIILKKEFYCNNSKGMRYIIKNSFDQFILDIKREFALNYSMFIYSFVEKIKYNTTFISILGTNTLGYKNPNISSNNIYKKVKIKNQKYDLVKHIVPKEELPEDYKQKEYRQDGYGNWYFFTKRYLPSTKKFKDTKYDFWEYQQNNIRLLIEVDSYKKEDIKIYKGKEITLNNISLYTSQIIDKRDNKLTYSTY